MNPALNLHVLLPSTKTSFRSRYIEKLSWKNSYTYKSLRKFCSHKFTTTLNIVGSQTIIGIEYYQQERISEHSVLMAGNTVRLPRKCWQVIHQKWLMVILPRFWWLRGWTGPPTNAADASGKMRPPSVIPLECVLLCWIPPIPSMARG